MFKTITVDLDDVDANGVCEAQDPGAAANLSLDGALVSGGVATFDVARQLVMASTTDDSGLTITITGTDPDGYALTEAVNPGPNTSVESTEYFKTVTQVAVDGDPAGDISVGTVDEVMSNTIPLDRRNITAASISVNVTGTIDFTIQETFEDVVRPGKAPQSAYANALWSDISALADKTVDTTSTASVGATAIRWMVNSYTNGAELLITINQPYEP